MLKVLPIALSCDYCFAHYCSISGPTNVFPPDFMVSMIIRMDGRVLILQIFLQNQHCCLNVHHLK